MMPCDLIDRYQRFEIVLHSNLIMTMEATWPFEAFVPICWTIRGSTIQNTKKKKIKVHRPGRIIVAEKWPVRDLASTSFC